MKMRAQVFNFLVVLTSLVGYWLKKDPSLAPFWLCQLFKKGTDWLAAFKHQQFHYCNF